jgi:hypothetical protein
MLLRWRKRAANPQLDKRVGARPLRRGNPHINSGSLRKSKELAASNNPWKRISSPSFSPYFAIPKAINALS